MGNNPYAQLKQATLDERQFSLAKQTQQIRKLAQQLKIDNVKAFQIANMNVYELVQLLNNGQLTSQQLLTALALRTITIGRNLNLITYLYFSEALVIARKCDEERKASKKKNITLKDMAAIKNDINEDIFLPPLFGIPISIKDVFHLQGRLATLGLLSNANKKHDQSILITCFRNSGMIPFVQTNVPQLAMATQTVNNLFGRSLNPWSKSRSTGGSSGGQGALIGSRCSVLGVGSDIGGSIRIPCQFNGIFGLKPYSRRISASYHAALSKYFQAFQQTMHVCIGPLAKSAQDLALFMAVVTNQKFYQQLEDPYTKIVPFQAKKYMNHKNPSKTFKIGYLKSLKDIEASLASQRAIQQVIEILKKQGHEILQIQIPNQKQIIIEFSAEYIVTGGKNYKQALAGEKPINQYRTGFLVGGLRAPGRFLASTIAKYFMPRTYEYVFSKRLMKQIIQYQKHIGQVQQMRNDWIKYWRKIGVDFIITPGFGCQAVPHGMSQKLGLAASYTFIWNLLDMTVGSIPVTRVREDEQQIKSRFNDLLTADFKKVGLNSTGLPVGIQVVGLPYQEEKVLGFMAYLDSKINFNKKYGAPIVNIQ